MRILVGMAEMELLAAVTGALAFQGHELTVVQDGFQALAECRENPPDLLLTAFQLPGLDGLELARLVRLMARQRFVPILMFTAAAPPEFFQQCLEAGVVEFVSEPFAPEELRSRVETLARLVRLQNALLENQAENEEEQRAVKHLLGKIAGTDPEATHGFRMETLQTKRINGDACAYRSSVPGVHFGMICDATGHGLMAGVSTIPVLETFLGMVDRDLPLATIYREIHAKLIKLLPTGRFACLLLLRVDVDRGILSVLNAGMPDVGLLRGAGTLQRFSSRVLPAGISGADPGVVVNEAAIMAGDRIFACSDGLADLVPEDALLSQYLQAPAHLTHQGHCALIRNKIDQTVRGEEHCDDVSWALWEVPGPTVPMRREEARLEPAASLVPGFQTTFRFDPRVCAPRDLVPQVLTLLLNFQVSHARAQLFGMLLTEALTNAVDHGLLQLASAFKAEGFEVYEQHRQSALAKLVSGQVSLTVTFFQEEGLPAGPVRQLKAEVKDSGAGFDWRAWTQARAEDSRTPFGRGIALVRSLGQELTFNETGTQLSFYLDCR